MKWLLLGLAFGFMVTWLTSCAELRVVKNCKAVQDLPNTFVCEDL